MLQGSGLPQAWSGQRAWRILETRFDQGLHFLTTWRAWKNDPSRPHLLHYVALTPLPAGLDALRASAGADPELLELVDELAPHWFGLLPGFHRLTLNDGQVLLTLCVGDTTTLLRAQQFVADSVYIDGPPPAPAVDSPWNVWTVKALARCCRRGTTLATTATNADLQRDLKQCGFENGQFNPRWEIKNTREPAFGRATEVASCTVIGAGLAGASVAAALAKRGWQVQVLDQGDAPAAGASGLPVGLVVPHVSADDCPQSRLSRSGVRLMLHQARSLLQQGQDWDATGTQQQRVDEATGLPPIWHTQAAWLKPAQLVKAWLAQPGVTFQGGTRVASVRQSGAHWELLDEQGRVLNRANRVIFANAGGALPLLETLQTNPGSAHIDVKQLPVMHGVRGLLSWAMHPGTPDAAFPLFPVNGAGSVVPAVPIEGGSAWFIGSSYQPESRPESPDAKNHSANFGRLQKLLPALGQALSQQFADGRVNAWKSTRCVTADRLPVVGPLYPADQPSLWICAGMGSRGLSFSVLCAELLAAQWGAEPLPVEAGLAQSLTALRQ
jgi:tRNA 5-methylaminomethyl-2-thiouridine biosynthesis bifunctional protein